MKSLWFLVACVCIMGGQRPVAHGIPWPPSSVVRSVRVMPNVSASEHQDDQKPKDLSEIIGRFKNLLKQRQQLEEMFAQPLAVVRMTKTMYDSCLQYRTRSHCDKLASTHSADTYGYNFLNNDVARANADDPHRSVDF